MDVDPSTPHFLTSRVRGLMLGLTLGDAMAVAGKDAMHEPNRAGTRTQIAAFTAEGLIRASVRFTLKGICHPPSVIWHAYRRWGHAQGLNIQDVETGGSTPWPDGWLVEVPTIGRRRGTAPSTVASLATNLQPGAPAGRSGSSHAVTRALPLAAIPMGDLPRLAREVAALTHGDLDAQDAAAATAVMAHHLLTAPLITPGVPSEAVDLAVLATTRPAVRAAIEKARDQARPGDGHPDLMQALVPDDSAVAALAGAVYAVLSWPLRGNVNTGLKLAMQVRQPHGVAALTGGLLGALHGAEAFEPWLVADLELGWVMDTLARDMVAEMVEHPAGGGYGPAPDPYWWHRYPGW